MSWGARHVLECQTKNHIALFQKSGLWWKKHFQNEERLLWDFSKYHLTEASCIPLKATKECLPFLIKNSCCVFGGTLSMAIHCVSASRCQCRWYCQDWHDHDGGRQKGGQVTLKRRWAVWLDERACVGGWVQLDGELWRSLNLCRVKTLHCDMLHCIVLYTAVCAEFVFLQYTVHCSGTVSAHQSCTVYTSHWTTVPWLSSSQRSREEAARHW